MKNEKPSIARTEESFELLVKSLLSMNDIFQQRADNAINLSISITYSFKGRFVEKTE